MSRDGETRLRTQGYAASEHEMTIGDSWRCGDIKNGVVFDCGEGCGVVSFEDFERAYHAVVASRRTRGIE